MKSGKFGEGWMEVGIWGLGNRWRSSLFISLWSSFVLGVIWELVKKIEGCWSVWMKWRLRDWVKNYSMVIDF